MRCDDCDDKFDPTEIRIIQNSGKALCKDCCDWSYSRCDGCGEYWLKSDFMAVSGDDTSKPLKCHRCRAVNVYPDDPGEYCTDCDAHGEEWLSRCEDCSNRENQKTATPDSTKINELLNISLILIRRLARAQHWFMELGVHADDWPDWVRGGGTIFYEFERTIQKVTGSESSDDLNSPDDPGGMSNDDPETSTLQLRIRRALNVN